jgi:hypothetical protein
MTIITVWELTLLQLTLSLIVWGIDWWVRGPLAAFRTPILVGGFSSVAYAWLLANQRVTIPWYTLLGVIAGTTAIACGIIFLVYLKAAPQVFKRTPQVIQLSGSLYLLSGIILVGVLASFLPHRWATIVLK